MRVVFFMSVISENRRSILKGTPLLYDFFFLDDIGDVLYDGEVFLLFVGEFVIGRNVEVDEFLFFQLVEHFFIITFLLAFFY